MKKFLTIIGARPQIIKAAALSRIIRTSYQNKVKEVIVHTGQHYDSNMSEQFFEELNIPRPDYNLQVGSGKHGEQTAKMIMGIEEILGEERPDYLIIYGDTNSTLAGAVAAAKIHVPIVHIEAGLRSFNKMMPEETNRVLCDHISTFLFPPTTTGMNNLIREGFSLTNKPPYSINNPAIFNVGDVMYDNSMYFSEVAERTIDINTKFNLNGGDYVLATLHRDVNTDNKERLNVIFESLHRISQLHQIKVVLPLHPRTAKQIARLLDPDLNESIKLNLNFMMLPPVSFLEMIRLEQKAKLIVTDSGGVQKEAYYFKKPCIILRNETEWVEIVESGAAILCGADRDKILDAYQLYDRSAPKNFVPFYGEGNAAERIVQSLIDFY